MKLPRHCRYCGKEETKQPNDWYDPNSSSGRSAGHCCKQCWVSKSVEWRKSNLGRWNARRHRTSARNKYGVTDTEYDRLFDNPVCAICGTSTGRLVIDHDHATGLVRGILCAQCNLVLGNAKDDPNILIRAAEYICRVSSAVQFEKEGVSQFAPAAEQKSYSATGG